MRESAIEKKLVKLARSKGWAIHKWETTERGAPDRILLKDGKILFVEVKKSGEKPRANQITFALNLKKNGFKVLYYDGQFHSDYERLYREVLLQNQDDCLF